VGKKFIGMLWRDAVFIEFPIRKILEIIGHDDIGATAYCGGEHMSILGVRQLHCRNQVFEISNETVPDIHIHKLLRSDKVCAGEIRTVCENSVYPLVMDHGRPFRTEKIRERELHEKIAKRGRIKDASVIESGERRQL